MREWSQRGCLNPRPIPYDGIALHLSYAGLGALGRYRVSGRLITGELLYTELRGPIHLPSTAHGVAADPSPNDFKQLDDALPNVHGLVIGRSREDVNGFRQFILRPFFHTASLHFRHAEIYPVFRILVDNRILVAIAPPVLLQPIAQFLSGPIRYE